jgi:hypothetical protein
MNHSIGILACYPLPAIEAIEEFLAILQENIFAKSLSFS